MLRKLIFLIVHSTKMWCDCKAHHMLPAEEDFELWKNIIPVSMEKKSRGLTLSLSQRRPWSLSFWLILKISVPESECLLFFFLIASRQHFFPSNYQLKEDVSSFLWRGIWVFPWEVNELVTPLWWLSGLVAHPGWDGCCLWKIRVDRSSKNPDFVF